MLTSLINNTNSAQYLQNVGYNGFIQNQMPQEHPVAPADKVSVSAPELMTDEEAQEVMSEVQSTVFESPADALSVHSGLDFSRVMALLAED